MIEAKNTMSFYHHPWKEYLGHRCRNLDPPRKPYSDGRDIQRKIRLIFPRTSRFVQIWHLEMSSVVYNTPYIESVPHTDNTQMTAPFVDF